MPRRRALGQAFRERLAGSTRGRASRSRCKSDVATFKAIADYLPTQKARATKSRAWTIKRPRSFYVREILPAPEIGQRQRIRFLDPNGVRGDLPAVRQLEIKCSTWNICFVAATQKLNAPYSQVTGDVALDPESEECNFTRSPSDRNKMFHVEHLFYRRITKAKRSVFSRHR